MESPPKLSSEKSDATWLDRWKRALAVLAILSIIAGALAIFHIPLNLLLFATPVFGVFLLLKKLRQHNRISFREVGAKRMIWSLVKAFVALIPLSVIVAPGLLIGSLASNYLNRGIDRLSEWSGPAPVQVEILRNITQSVEERVKRHLPWWYGPAVYIGLADDYMTMVRTEVVTISETISQMASRPWYIRGVAGSLKFLLQALSLASFTWAGLLVIQLFLGLWGRSLICGQLISIQLYRGESEMDGETTAPASKISFSAKLPIDLTTGETLFVRRTEQPAGAVPDVSFRFKGGALVARAFYGLVCMNRIPADLPEPVVFLAPGSFNYVSVKVRDGQELVVDPEALVAFSDSIRFVRHWEFNLAVVGLHHVRFLIAKGPGQMILKCDGRPTIPKNPRDLPKSPMHRLILFDADSVFRPEAAEGFFNYLMSPCAVKVDKGLNFVASPTSTVKTGRIQNLWTFIKQCYVPI